MALVPTDLTTAPLPGGPWHSYREVRPPVSALRVYTPFTFAGVSYPEGWLVLDGKVLSARTPAEFSAVYEVLS